MDSAELDPTSNTTTENPELLAKGSQLQTDAWVTSTRHSRDAQGHITTRGRIHTDIGRQPITADSLVQITNWASQTLPSQEEESFKHSRYRIGGSADSVLSITSSHSLLPLEWKILRSSQSQDTLAHFSGVTLENTDEGHKPANNNQDVVDDIIGGEVTFKVCAHVLNHNSGATYAIDSRADYPTVLHAGSPTPKDATYAKQFSDGSLHIPVLHSRTEKVLEVGMKINEAHSSTVDQQGSHLIDQLWIAAASPKSSYNSSTASVGWGSNSNNHEPIQSPVLSEFQLKSPAENKEELTQPMKKVLSEDQPLLQEKDINEQPSVSSLPKFECSSPVILQQWIVNLQCQISDLREANETAVLELAKADEEMSQLKNEIAELKSEYLQKLADSKEENLVLKQKITRIHKRRGPVGTYEQALHEEIYELRSESRSLREISHQLNEENHRLKEELLDIKRQYQWLVYTVAGKQDERLRERSRNNASPSSTNSESTEILIAGYCDTGQFKESRDLKDVVPEKSTRESSNNPRCTSQHSQLNHENSEQRISSSASSSLSSNRVHMDKAAIPRRPFAPRSVTDLKVGNLVKFSHPSGKLSKGTVKYLGPLFGREEAYLGIELEGNQVGRHDGTFQGTRYFLW